MDRNLSYIPKEISWLSFNERVLQEAENPKVPLMERFKFMGIYSNNLDEFFRVRVATLGRLSQFGIKSENLLGFNPTDTIRIINKIVIKQSLRFEKNYELLLRELANYKIFIVNEKQLNRKQSDFIKEYYHIEIRTRLMPFIIQDDTELPDLVDDAIYFLVCLNEKDSGRLKYALMEIPSKILPRFIVLPGNDEETFIMFLDDIIRFGLKEIFFLFQFNEISAYTIKLTRDAELEISDDISGSYIDNISKSLQRRKKGNPVRFVFDRSIPGNILKTITKKIHIGKDDVIIPGNRYHNFKDFMNFPDLGKREFYFPSVDPLPHKDISTRRSILNEMRKKDIMLYFPYHSFEYLIDFLRESSLDPGVHSIQITLYRLARNSNVINALLNAARNGKEVITVVELQARFEEEANIHWGNKLLAEGVRVIYGVPGLKVHSKLCLVTRSEKGILQRYALVGTGNFNEFTAGTYTDNLLMTTNKKITNEVDKVFSFFRVNYKQDRYYHLILSPFHLRRKAISLIENEILNAKSGKEAYINLKLNNLTDPEIIGYLYKASKAGVKIRLIIRGMLSLVPGVRNLSENIQAIGIVDRFLEHSRFMIFYNGGDEQVFISSADLMTRNLDYRFEVTCPIFDRRIKVELINIFEIYWNDNVKARIFNETQSNMLVENFGKPYQSQLEIYNYLEKAICK
jgi:polyphosphate kinase